MTLTSFTDEISPFPDAGTLLYDRRNSNSPASGFQPLQKLRPIRNNGTDSLPPRDPPERFASQPENNNTAELVPGFFPHVLPLQKCSPISDSPSSGGELQSDDDGAGGSSGSGGFPRWPVAETQALLKIRLEMESQFRSSNPKAHLWETISKKLEEMGYNRDSKKCREKFENVYKYYKKTKGRLIGGGSVGSGSSRVGSGSGNASVKGGKLYRFCNELQALDNQNKENVPNKMVVPETSSSEFVSLVTSSGDDEMDEDFNVDRLVEMMMQVDETEKRKSRKRFEKLKPYMECLVDKVMKQQEVMYKQVMETLDKKEKEWLAREEARKKQEMERERRERELRAQENSQTVALISLLGNVLGERIPVPEFPEIVCSQEDRQENKSEVKEVADAKNKRWPESRVQGGIDPNSRRWPKSEVQALIALRTVVHQKYHNSASRKPVWEEISLGMASIGYSRSAKKCKEKWDNINKYFKRALGSGKPRPENAKTCPYFHELSILYQNGNIDSVTSPGGMTSEGDARSEHMSDSAGASTLISMSQTLRPEEVQSASALDCSNVVRSARCP